MTSTNDYLIDIRNLNFNYQSSDDSQVNDSLILNKVNLSIKNNEFVAVCGPSGSGKSTLFYVLGGLMRKYNGEVLFSGNELKNFDEEQLASFRNKNIGFIFQSFYLLPKLTVLENILLPITYSASDKTDYENRAKGYLQEFGLLDKMNTLPGKLSGGQQQRVAIIRSLINEPDIILADEPTGNLDSKNSKQIMSLLKSIHKKGKTILIITHDLEVANECEKVIFLKDGQIDKITINEINQVPKEKISKFNLKIERTPIRYFYSFKLAIKNLGYQKMRTFINMLGIIIGIAAVFSMVTLGIYSKERILESYASLGVNTIGFNGYPNWEMRATDKSSRVF
ncbi:MAG: ATP-binding cassette domain-containing protein, partial [Bacteriovoracaceae bacterium]